MEFLMKANFTHKGIAVMTGRWDFLNYTKLVETLWYWDENSLIFIAKVVNMQFEVYLLLHRAILQLQRQFLQLIVHLLLVTILV